MNRWVRVLLLRLLVLPTICALVVGVGLRYWFGVQDPQVTIPSPTMPSPNGFDLLKKAGENLRPDHDTIGQLSIRRSAYGEWDWQGNPLNPTEKERLQAKRMAQLSDLMRRHADTLALTRQALGMPYRMPSLRSWNDLCPYYADFRDLARLMVLEVEYAKAKGASPDEAARKYLDVIRLGEKISHGGPLIGRLVSIAVTAIGQHALAPMATEVPPAMARNVIQSLKRCQQNRAPFVETMVEEKYGMQAGILELYRHPERFMEAASEEEHPSAQAQQVRMLPIAYLIWGKRTMFENVTRQMDETIEQAKQPYRADTPEIKPADDPISQFVFPVFSQARFKEVLIRAQDELLIARFAAEAFRKEKGEYPLTRTELTRAGYPLPVDPFADGAPLGYKLRGLSRHANAIFYSVGPDRKDDGGKPGEKTDISARGANRYRVNPGSKGDIVPGVNVFSVSAP